MNYIQYSSRSQISQVDTPTPTPLSTETPAEGDTANWKTYENKEHGYAVKYPSDFKLFFDGKTPIIMKPGGEREGTGAFSFYQITFTPLNTNKELQDLVTENINTSKQIWGENSPEFKSISSIYEAKVGSLKGLSFDLACVGYCHNIFIKKDATKSFQITVRNANQEVKNVYQSEVDQILSTFKFINESSTPTPTITPTSKPKTTYIVPTSWKRFTTQSGVNLCLPPKWEVEAYDHLVFNRDEGYKPSITYITNLPYSGGSRREAYFAYWASEYPDVDVKQLVSVTDTDINGNSALTIYPANSSDPKTSPEGLTVVWYSAGKLWKAGLSGWNMTNTSQTSFLKDFYTMISCSL